MGIFSRILDRLRSGPVASNPSAGQPGAQRVPQQQTQDMTMQGGAQQGTQMPPQHAQQEIRDVDVEQVLSQMAAKKGGGGNWRESIVDLLKLLDLDSSLEARKELARELNVNAGAHGSAEQNIALQKAVWRELAKNGGKVPASLRD